MSIALQTSTRGQEVIAGHEGVVLKAYRCPAGIWTIGVGHTSAAGAPKVTAGMTITRDQAFDIFRRDLRKFEARVTSCIDLTKAPHAQAAFDGSTSFDFNTGKITSATWVKLFNAGKMKQASASLMSWVKGGGKVLPGLSRRRGDEGSMIFGGIYPSAHGTAPKTPVDTWASWVVANAGSAQAEARAALAKLGYAVGDKPPRIARVAVEAFQRDHDLTVDGKIGRATLATLQRELDARSRTKAATGTTAAGGAAAGGNEAASQIDPTIAFDPSVTTVGIVVAVLGGICLAVLAYRYRDVIAARVQHRFPRLAARLRSF